MSSYNPNQPPAGGGQPDQIICPNCRGGNAPNATTCQWCGQLLPTTMTADLSQPEQPAATQQPPPQYPPQAQYQPQYPQQPQPGAAPQYQPQYQQQPPLSTPPAPAPRGGGGRRILLIVGGIVLLLVIGCVVLFGSVIGAVFGLTQPAVDAGDKFMAALRDGDYNRAYDLSHSSLQQQVGTADDLRQALELRAPATWSFTTRNINNGIATLQGSTTFKDGASGTVDMELRQESGAWKVSFVDLK